MQNNSPIKNRYLIRNNEGQKRVVQYFKAKIKKTKKKKSC